jgi:hypothetical protein
MIWVGTGNRTECYLADVQEAANFSIWGDSQLDEKLDDKAVMTDARQLRDESTFHIHYTRVSTDIFRCAGSSKLAWVMNAFLGLVSVACWSLLATNLKWSSGNSSCSDLIESPCIRLNMFA